MLYKLLTVCLVMTSLVGCGVAEDLSKKCPGNDVEMLCNTLFGSRNNEQDKEINSLEIELKDLKNKVNNNITLLNLLNTQFITVNESIESLKLTLMVLENNNNTQQMQIDMLQDRLDNLEHTADVQETTMVNLQQDVTNSVIRIAELEGYHNITRIVDPCGAASGFNEVLLETSQGEVLAYFESGSRRFLTKLLPGNYVTTDGTNCHFTYSLSSGLTW